MKTPDAAVLDSIEQQIAWSESDCTRAGHALPSGSLRFITELIRRFEVRRAFEFGSGSSTRAMLATGCAVTCLENDEHWLGKTLEQIPEHHRARLTACCLPLERVLVAGYPCLGWTLDAIAADRLRSAEFVLVDSPEYPPFR